MLGEGENSVGERLPRLFDHHRLQDIQVFLNDKTSTLVPPYSSEEDRLLAEEIVEQARTVFFIWRREDASRYYLAGGGDPKQFERLWAAAIRQLHSTADQVNAGSYATAGGAVGYLVSGRKASAPSARTRPRLDEEAGLE